MSNLHDAIVGRDVEMVRIRYVRIRLLKMQLSNGIYTTIKWRKRRSGTHRLNINAVNVSGG